MTEEEEYELAERLAEAMGMELKRFPEVDGIRLYEKGNGISVGGWPWFGRNDLLRGTRGRRGMLDIGTSWMSGWKSLPPGITKDSTDEEIDLTLSVMGF